VAVPFPRFHALHDLQVGIDQVIIQMNGFGISPVWPIAMRLEVLLILCAIPLGVMVCRKFLARGATAVNNL
jgi:hypothetical protein